MSYTTLLPSYYANIIVSQQSDLSLGNLYWFVADGTNKSAQANTNPKSLIDHQIVVNQILYGGKVTPSNVHGLIKRINWISGEKYEKYNSRDVNLSDKDFYVMNSQQSVYKCLDNNNNGISLYEPTSIETGPITLADGYIWQFMYKLTNNQMLNYTVDNLIPIIVNDDVTNAAIRGTITSIDVVEPGEYSATHEGIINTIVSNTVFKISDDAHPTSGSYNTMGIYISSGTSSGTIRQIDNYVANTSGKWIQVDKPISNLTPSSHYSIAPLVNIRGNGFESTARSVMNGTRINKIEIINSGHDYTLADIDIIANTNYINNKATALANISPIQGHGSNVSKELFADHMLIDINLDNYVIDEDLISKTTFCKIGLIKNVVDENDPTKQYDKDIFDNTFTMQITPSYGSYDVGDTLTLLSSTYPTSKVVYANTTHVIGVYETPINRYSIGNNLINQNGVTGIVTDITNPDVKFIDGDVVALINTDTIQRDENSTEKLQLVINIR